MTRLPRILLVDDEPMILSSYRRALRSLEVELVLSEGPSVALRALEEAPADVVVADYGMPGMNGDEFLGQVRARWPNSVRILVTAYTDLKVVEDVVRRGEIFRFLTKPCDPERLIGAITDGLEHGREIEANKVRQQKRELDLHTYRQFFESSLDPMMIADLRGDLIEVNNAFVGIHGDDRANAIQNRARVVDTFAEASLNWSDIRRALHTTGHWSGEVRRAGYVALLSAATIHDDNGNPYAYAVVEKDVTSRYRVEEQARAAQYEVILALARLAEYRDPETGAHLERMRRYSQILARRLMQKGGRGSAMDESYVEAVYYSSPLHDVGKVGIPDAALLKPGKLTPEEWVIMQRHTTIGAEVLAAAGSSLANKGWLSLAQTIALEHHEKVDGTGYPRGLKGDEIDISARIVALADAYDAITSKRVYKDSLSHDVARERITSSSGSHFDTQVVEAFLECEGPFGLVRDTFTDDKLSLAYDRDWMKRVV